MSDAQRTVTEDDARGVASDVVALEAEEYHEINETLAELGAKLAIATVDGLKRRTNDLVDLAPDRCAAVELLLQGVWDSIA